MSVKSAKCEKTLTLVLGVHLDGIVYLITELKKKNPSTGSNTFGMY